MIERKDQIWPIGGGLTARHNYDGDGMRTVRRDEGTGEERYLLHGPGTQLRAEYKRVNDTLVPVREYISLGDRVVASVDQVPGTPPSSCNLTFTDDPIVANVTPVKAVHVTELRTAINCVRAWYGLAAYGWTDPTITTDVTVVSAVHVEQMRTALNEAYTQGGVTPPSYTDPSLSGVGIKALHFNQLRQAVRDLPPPQPATTAAMRYYHTDPLGSVRAITDANGAQVERRDYYAFGDSQPLEGNPIRFTGKELDVANVGLTYFGARYYTHVDARFTTVDPYLDPGEALNDPQRWNRYAYALNSPETLVDPTGLQAGCSYVDNGSSVEVRCPKRIEWIWYPGMDVFTSQPVEINPKQLPTRQRQPERSNQESFLNCVKDLANVDSIQNLTHAGNGFLASAFLSNTFSSLIQLGQDISSLQVGETANDVAQNVLSNGAVPVAQRVARNVPNIAVAFTAARVTASSTSVRATIAAGSATLPIGSLAQASVKALANVANIKTIYDAGITGAAVIVCSR